MVVSVGLLTAACQHTASYSPQEQAKVRPSKTLSPLEELQPPTKKISVAIYDFPDLTGAFKPNDGFAEFSKAVPQGADAIVIDALIKAGRGSWFHVLERKGLTSLVQERKIIDFNRDAVKKSRARLQQLSHAVQKSLQGDNPALITSVQPGNINTNTSNALALNPQTNMFVKQGTMQPISDADLGEDTSKHYLRLPEDAKNKQDNRLTTASVAPKKLFNASLPSKALLRSADYIIQGGIVGYDTDEITGGAGASLLNIGGFGEVRKDIVTVNLRLVNVKTGEIILNKTLSKGIYSQRVQASTFSYIDIDKILEAEVGYSHNEPVYEALNLTIQTAVLEMIQDGIHYGLWQTLPKIDTAQTDKPQKG